MINNLQDFSKAKYHTEQLAPHMNNIGAYNKSILFLFNCMEEKLDSLKEFEEELNHLKLTYINGLTKVETSKINFYILDNLNLKNASELLNKPEKEIEKNLIINQPVFLSNERLYIPKETNLEKDIIYLGSYNVYMELL